jgi:ATP-dependent Clp protease adaptor protein ClpS
MIAMTDNVTLPEITVRTKEKQQDKTKKQPPYHVILLNDDDHSFEYVIGMLQRIFGHPPERGYKMAVEVHTRGRVIVDTTSKERAELKRDQIHAFGADPWIERCQGSMSATIEAAE